MAKQAWIPGLGRIRKHNGNKVGPPANETRSLELWKRAAARTLVIVCMHSYFDFHVYVFVPTPLIFSKLCKSHPHLDVKEMAWIIKENDSQKNKERHQNMSLLLFHHHTTVVC